MSEVQLIHHAIQKLRACGPLYGRALSVWNSKDSDYPKVWANFCATIDKQYVEMLARQGDTTLAEDGYAAYNAMAKEDNTTLSENLGDVSCANVQMSHSLSIPHTVVMQWEGEDSGHEPP